MSAESQRHIIVARHGDLHNPSGIIYNRDSVMRPEDVMHLSDNGKAGMRKLAEEIKSAGFNCVAIYTSPETRTRESAGIMAEILNITDIEIKDGLDDVLCPAPYRQKMTMKELEDRGGDVYYLCQEKPENIARRMEPVFWELYRKLRNGETGIIMSHGDPTGWLLHQLINHSLPDPKHLRDGLYLPKSGAMVITLSGNRMIASHKPLFPSGNGNTY
jgi:broad specificity phosphatase PhoE